MQFSQESDTSSYVIRAYRPGEVTLKEPVTIESILSAAADPSQRSIVKNNSLSSSAIIMPKLLLDWPPQTLSALSQLHVERIVELRPEIVLLGTGTTLTWPDDQVLTPLVNGEIGFEIMDTASACRTYNILMYEGRNVAAALIMK